MVFRVNSNGKPQQSKVTFGAKRGEQIAITIDTKVQNSTDKQRVYRFFLTSMATSLVCARTLGLPRDSVSSYVAKLIREKLLFAVGRYPDPITGCLAMHYTSNPQILKAVYRNEFPLFANLSDEEKGGAL